MTVLEFVASLISSLATVAWPVVIVALGWRFLTSQQSALTRLIDRVKGVRAGKFELQTLSSDATPDAKEATRHVGRASGETTWTGAADGVVPPQGRGESPSKVEPFVELSRGELEFILTQYGQAGWDIALMGSFRNRPRPVIEWDADGVPQLLYWTTDPGQV